MSEGGHGIPDDAIERRYYDSLKNLSNIIEICDEINIYDNTDVIKEIMNFENGSLVWRHKIIPAWANCILKSS